MELYQRKRSLRHTAGESVKRLEWTCVFAFLGLLTLLWALLGALPAAAVNENRAESPFVAVGQEVRPAVVNVRISRSVTKEGVGTGPLQELYRQFFPDEVGKGNRFELPSTGSGFVVSADGDILTNHHVIAEADGIFVRFSGETREYRAEVLGSDPNTDLALLRIDPGSRTLPVLTFADSDALAVGAWAIAVGNPFGNLESSLTVGVVSAKGRGGLTIAGGSPRYQDFIQTDASINLGNSGGPLVDINGRLIGVNTAINQRGQGIGFAVPSNMVRWIYAQLREQGRVIRGYLGILTEDVVQIVGEEHKGEPPFGARILEVVEGSPAAAAGLLPGDVVVGLAGSEVASSRQLQFMIAKARPGQTLSCAINRAGRQEKFSVAPVELIEEELAAGLPQVRHWLGLEVADLEGADPRVARLREALGVTVAAGVMTVVVEEDQPGQDAGIARGTLWWRSKDRKSSTWGIIRTPLLCIVSGANPCPSFCEQVPVKDMSRLRPACAGWTFDAVSSRRSRNPHSAKEDPGGQQEKHPSVDARKGAGSLLS